MVLDDKFNRPTNPAMIENQKVAALTAFTGKTLAGKYRFIDLLGVDPAGAYYEGASIIGDRGVLILALREEVSFDRRFQDQPINHPNIAASPQLLTISSKRRFLITGLPRGETLETVVHKKKKLHPGPATSAILQVLSALHAIHARDSFHGNLSPRNVFLAIDGNGEMEVKVVFGGEIRCLSLPTEPNFLSPEQILGDSTPDKRSDLWAAGALIYFMLFGSFPFTGDSADEISGKILLKDPVLPPESKQLPHDLVGLMKSALIKDVERRPQNATTMIGDLWPVLEEFDEQMNDLVATALRNSLTPTPPPPEDQEDRVTLVEEPKLAKSPLARRSAPAAEPKRPVRPTKKTMVGTPAATRKVPPRKDSDEVEVSIFDPEVEEIASVEKLVPKAAARPVIKPPAPPEVPLPPIPQLPSLPPISSEPSAVVELSEEYEEELKSMPPTPLRKRRNRGRAIAIIAASIILVSGVVLGLILVMSDASEKTGDEPTPAAVNLQTAPASVDPLEPSPDPVPTTEPEVEQEPQVETAIEERPHQEPEPTQEQEPADVDLSQVNPPATKQIPKKGKSQNPDKPKKPSGGWASNPFGG